MKLAQSAIPVSVIMNLEVRAVSVTMNLVQSAVSVIQNLEASTVSVIMNFLEYSICQPYHESCRVPGSRYFRILR